MKLSEIADATLLRTMVNASTDGFSLAKKVGNDTVLIYVNESFERITGYAADEILYRDCRFLQRDDTQQPECRILHHAVENNQHCCVRLRNYRKNGEMFWNEVSLTPYFDEFEQTMYFIGTQRDVSEEMHLREQLARYQSRYA